MFKKKKQEQQEQQKQQEIMCDIVLRKKLLIHGIWNYENDKEIIKTKEELKQKGFTFIKKEITNNLYGHWEEEIWEKQIGTQLY